MRFGVYVPTSGEYDVPTLVGLAREAEQLGWDGIFLWDNLLATFDDSGALDDTTVALTAVVLATEKVHCGPLVTPLARRRPWKVAKEMATLDRLSGGRLVLGVGAGGTWDFAPFSGGWVGEEGRHGFSGGWVGEEGRHGFSGGWVGEEGRHGFSGGWVGEEGRHGFSEVPPGRERGAVLDEALAVVTACWTGQDVHHRGRYFTVDGARMRPVPVQQPRIPIWTAGYWPARAPFVRAARWDGVAPLRKGHLFEGLTPGELAACLAFVGEHRDGAGPLDAVYFHTRPDDGAQVGEYEQAGATWWLESTNPGTESLGDFRARVRAGPPHG